MGGRGSSGGGGGGGGGSRSSADQKSFNINTKFSKTEINMMSRSQLETVATAIFIKKGIASGLSSSEAAYRAKSLMSGNTNAQLKRYINKNG